MLERAAILLKKHFGYHSFKPGQEQIIYSLLQRQDTMGIMPTGGGKSICYQIPALMSGATLVISPLISLMKDQVEALCSLGIPAAFINSSLNHKELLTVLKGAVRGMYKVIYAAPERLENEQFIDMANNLGITLLAVDEAHCVSQWGHDFRPAYLMISPFIKKLAQRPVIAAFTATATPEVTRDIINQLALDKPNVVITEIDRANLFFTVINGENKRGFVDRYLAENKDKPGIIYGATRKEVDKLHAYLQQKGFSTGKYHAGMSAAERDYSQECFIYDHIRVMVATNAFGMGIDKSNVRYVIHYHMPKNMEAYYQEAGRAGRDDEPAECILLFSPQDVQIQRYLIENSIPSAERRDSEYKKLQYIVNYCHTSRCLRGEILQYFGQKNSPKYCDNCSNCNNTGEFIDITVEAQKILSCAWRMKGQFGVTMLAGVLKGSKNKKLLQYGLNGLSSYGLLHNYTLKEIQHLVKVLIAEKYLCLTEGRYPIVKLLPGAAPVLKGEQRVFHRKRVKKHKEIANQPLFEQLRQLRLQIAQKERVPPYVVFPDSTLREMCEQLPADTSALLTIKGVGETRLKNYGQFFLEVLRSYVGGKNKTSSTNMQPGTEQENQTASHVITYNMYKEGKTIDEIARLRDLKAVTIQNHIIRCDREGYHINWNDFIDPQYEQLILGQVKKVGANRLKLIKDELPEEIDYFSIRAVICKFGFNTSPK